MSINPRLVIPFVLPLLLLASESEPELRISSMDLTAGGVLIDPFLYRRCGLVEMSLCYDVRIVTVC